MHEQNPWPRSSHVTPRGTRSPSWNSPVTRLPRFRPGHLRGLLGSPPPAKQALVHAGSRQVLSPTRQQRVLICPLSTSLLE